MTLTRRAFGAQTAKLNPATPLSVAADVAQRGDVLVGETAAEAVGVLARHRPTADLERQAVVRPRRRLEAGDEEAGVVPLLHRDRRAGVERHRGGARLRQYGAHLPNTGRDLMWTEDPERVAVLGRDDRRDGAFADGADELRLRGRSFRAKGRLSRLAPAGRVPTFRAVIRHRALLRSGSRERRGSAFRSSPAGCSPRSRSRRAPWRGDAAATGARAWRRLRPAPGSPRRLPHRRGGRWSRRRAATMPRRRQRAAPPRRSAAPSRARRSRSHRRRSAACRRRRGAARPWRAARRPAAKARPRSRRS